MLRKSHSGPVIAVAVTFTLTIPVLAKGTTVKLTISGPGIARPIDVTDRDAVDANVFAGNFIDWTKGEAPAPPAPEPPRYKVEFHIQPPRGAERVMYVVTFVPDASGRGLVYLPGRGDEWYRLNVGTIMRDEQDGHWYYASREWGRAIQRVLPAR